MKIGEQTLLDITWKNGSTITLGSYWLDPRQTWVRLLWDHETTYWHEERGVPLWAHRGWPRKAIGQPGTVNTAEKGQTSIMPLETQLFHRRLWCLSAFGTPDLAMFPLIASAFSNVMASNRVITNFGDELTGYMTLAMVGSVGKVIGEDNLPNFGPAWVIETLRMGGPLPDVEEAFYTMPHFVQPAVTTRYAKEWADDKGRPLPGSPYPDEHSLWQCVDPFWQLDAWDSIFVPIMLISKNGIAHVAKSRCRILTREELRHPINPFNPYKEIVYK